jgi:hypothetical protein
VAAELAAHGLAQLFFWWEQPKPAEATQGRTLKKRVPLMLQSGQRHRR